MSDVFTCAVCHETFPKAWTDEEAIAEAAQNFPGLDVASPGTAVICDDCFQEICYCPEVVTLEGTNLGSCPIHGLVSGPDETENTQLSKPD